MAKCYEHDEMGDCDHVVQVIPGGGWSVWFMGVDRVPFSRPVIAWGLSHAGDLKPMINGGASPRFVEVVDDEDAEFIGLALTGTESKEMLAAWIEERGL
jgi:hypothetical protein